MKIKRSILLCVFLLILVVVAGNLIIENNIGQWDYYRYIRNDMPPLLEHYVQNRSGEYELVSVIYDSDGDWRADTDVDYHANPFCFWKLSDDSPVVVKWGADKLSKVPDMMMRTDFITKYGDRFKDRLIEPKNCAVVNKNKFESTAYLRAIREVRDLGSCGARYNNE